MQGITADAAANILAIGILPQSAFEMRVNFHAAGAQTQTVTHDHYAENGVDTSIQISTVLDLTTRALALTTSGHGTGWTTNIAGVLEGDHEVRWAFDGVNVSVYFDGILVEGPTAATPGGNDPFAEWRMTCVQNLQTSQWVSRVRLANV